MTSLLLEPTYTYQDIGQPNARDIAKVNIMSWVTNEGYYRITAHNGSYTATTLLDNIRLIYDKLSSDYITHCQLSIGSAQY